MSNENGAHHNDDHGGGRATRDRHSGHHEHHGHQPQDDHAAGHDRHAGHDHAAGHDPHDAHSGHEGHADHAGHAGHGDHVGQFRRLFWIMCVFAVPVVGFNDMFANLIGYGLPEAEWVRWVSPVLGTIMYF